MLETLIFLKWFVIICLVLYGLWAVITAVLYLHELPQKRRTLYQIYVIRTRKEARDDAEEE